MPNWFVSGHGGIGAKSRARVLLAPTAKFAGAVTAVPWGVELVMYTPQADILPMTTGWELWYQLMHGQNGGEAAAYAAKHKSKKKWKLVPDYNTYGDDWTDNAGNWACGLYVVGDPINPIETWSAATGDTATNKLSVILKAAKAANVNRVYWGCCTEFF